MQWNPAKTQPCDLNKDIIPYDIYTTSGNATTKYKKNN